MPNDLEWLWMRSVDCTASLQVEGPYDNKGVKCFGEYAINYIKIYLSSGVLCWYKTTTDLLGGTGRVLRFVTTYPHMFCK